MFIKAWDDLDLRVFCVNKDELDRFLKTLPKFKPEEIKVFKQMADDFNEDLGLEFSHNFRRGWEKAILNEGKVSDKSGKELFSVPQIKESFRRDGIIEFHAYKKNTSLKFVSSLQKLTKAS